jgi:dienelactone hydrolase
MNGLPRGAMLSALLSLAVPLHGEVPAPTYPAPDVVKAAFLSLLDRPRVPLAAHVLETKPEAPGLVSERLRYDVEKKADATVETVPALVLRPQKVKDRRPAVIVLHGTGGSKEGEREHSFMVELAKRGFVALSFDARYHGERSGGAAKAEAYDRAIVRAWRAKPGEPQEHPWFFDTCWDVWRTLDYLETRADVDPSRIGAIGFSMGGIETWLAGSVDSRIKVAVPAISVQSFRWSLDNDHWQGRAKTVPAAHAAALADLGEKELNAKVVRALWDKVIPGVLGDFDGPSLIRLFAPDRPLLILGSDDDPNCPIEGARLAFAAAEKAYGSAASERLKVDLATGVGHRVTDEQRAVALDWFVRWLKP